MKEVFAITQNRGDRVLEFTHVLFGVNKDALRSATMQTDARKKINWNREVWGLFCTEESYDYIVEHMTNGGFDPYEVPETTDQYLGEMKMRDVCFYKEITMI